MKYAVVLVETELLSICNILILDMHNGLCVSLEYSGCSVFLLIWVFWSSLALSLLVLMVYMKIFPPSRRN